MLLAPSPPSRLLLLLLLFSNPTQAPNPPDNTQPSLPTPPPRRRLPPLNLAIPLIPLARIRPTTPVLPNIPSQPTTPTTSIDPNEPVTLIDELTSPLALAATEEFLFLNPSSPDMLEYAPRCVGVTSYLRDSGTGLPPTILFSLFRLELQLQPYQTPQDLCAAPAWGGAARSLGGACFSFPPDLFPGMPGKGRPVFAFKPGVRDEGMVGVQRLREFCLTLCGCEEPPDTTVDQGKYREHPAGRYYEPFEGYVWQPKVGKTFYRGPAMGGTDEIGQWKEGKEGKEGKRCRASRCWPGERVGGVEWVGKGAIGRAEGVKLWLGERSGLGGRIGG